MRLKYITITQFVYDRFVKCLRVAERKRIKE